MRYLYQFWCARTRSSSDAPPDLIRSRSLNGQDGPDAGEAGQHVGDAPVVLEVSAAVIFADHSPAALEADYPADDGMAGLVKRDFEPQPVRGGQTRPAA